MQDFVDRYVRDHLPTITEREQVAHRTILAEIGASLGIDRLVTAIHHGDLQAMHSKITKSGRRVRANRILGVASKLFSLSLLPLAGEDAPWRDASMGNPCKGVERNHEEGRERFFSPAELAAISDALAAYPGQTAAGRFLVMLTGCRPGEAMAAKGRSSMPSSAIGSSRALTPSSEKSTAPLTPAALELIARRRKQRNESEWVFPSTRPYAPTDEPIATLWHVWEHVRTDAKLGRAARIYDLRHTFASVGAGGGLSLQIIGRLLGHTLSRTTERASCR